MLRWTPSMLMTVPPERGPNLGVTPDTVMSRYLNLIHRPVLQDLQTNVSDENRVAASVTKAVKPKSRRVSFKKTDGAGVAWRPRSPRSSTPRRCTR